MADCYFNVGDYELANRHIEAAQRRQVDNAYVITLQIRIACKRGDEKTARDLLVLLEAIDNPSFAALRRSRVELAFGDVPSAYDAAVRSTSGLERPPFEALANLAICELRTGRSADGTVEKIALLYRRQKPNVQLGLRARIAITDGRFEDALGYCEKLEPADHPIHQALRRDALKGLLEHKALSSVVREESTAEVARVNELLLARFGSTDWEIDPD